MINSKILMLLSSLFMGAAGLALTFLPQEIAGVAGQNLPDHAVLALQVTGALYVGFAMLNWMAKGNLIGGIYSRPVAIGNFTHFLVAGMALLKAAFNAGNAPYLWFLALLYAAFALAFGLVTFTHPAAVKASVK